MKIGTGALYQSDNVSINASLEVVPSLLICCESLHSSFSNVNASAMRHVRSAYAFAFLHGDYSV